MSILLDRGTRAIVQGITGREGAFHTVQMLRYGTQIVGGVVPGKGGSLTDSAVPVFNTMADAVVATDANASIVFVPAPYAADAIMEACEVGLRLVVAITDGVPIQDMIRVVPVARASGTCLIGPNCPGVISPAKSLLGIMPAETFMEGTVGVVSRSGTLTYEIVHALTRAGFGQSTCVGIGGDPVLGTTFVDVLRMFEADAETEAIVLIGEIGGSDEEAAAEYCAEMTKPVVAFIGGRSAPAGKRMGHAGAIVSGRSGTAEAKVAALTAAGVPVADATQDVVGLVRAALERGKGVGRCI